MLDDRPLRRIVLAGVLALAVALAAVALAQGFSDNFAVRALQGVGVFACGAALLALVISAIVERMGGWREPEDEEEFERIVQRSERLAHQGTAADPEEMEFLELDPFDDEDFSELVREALDELPDLLIKALDHVAVVVSDKGRRHRAYGLYQGDTVARDNYPDRIIIFRDTLRRDFGHDPDLLRDQVTRTVRHELAHHLGADELGVRELGL
jgi:predicted Zn-dependent protease with MMP-like domain